MIDFASDNAVGASPRVLEALIGLAQGLATVPGVRLAWPARGNRIFAIIPPRIDEALKRAGARYYEWGNRGLALDDALRPDEVLIRLGHVIPYAAGRRAVVRRDRGGSRMIVHGAVRFSYVE